MTVSRQHQARRVPPGRRTNLALLTALLLACSALATHAFRSYQRSV